MRAEHGGWEPWGDLELIADEARRDFVQAHVKGHERPKPFPGSPLGPSKVELIAQQRARRAAHEAARKRDEERVAFLQRQQREEG